MVRGSLRACVPGQYELLEPESDGLYGHECFLKAAYVNCTAAEVGMRGSKTQHGFAAVAAAARLLTAWGSILWLMTRCR